MIHAFFLSLGQLFDRPMLRVFVKSLLLTAAIFAILGVGMWFAMDWLGALASEWAGLSGESNRLIAIARVAEPTPIAKARPSGTARAAACACG